MTRLSREEIFAQRPWPTEEVEVPEWGGTVLVRALSGTELDAFNSSITRQKGTAIEVNRQNYRAKLVQKCVVNGDGKSPLFQEEDIPALGMQPASALDAVLGAVNRLNKMTEEDHEDAIKN